ncbi:unnamed protein product [Clonostachys chloroleuca]|uniref:Protein lsb5 n=1 Tax=Clonostachys chloroleuca TaxID=1926264 RepID=A0AA35MK06_9HYPO|nr:unnamed protein product [Clonostachys chloroleuca]
MFQQKKPYSAVTVTIENLTGETYEEEDLSGIPELVEVIKLQASGPSEAARAIRKKLKYGNVHRQIRALVILDGLIQNAGPRFQRAFADEPLLERLRVCGTSDLSDPEVKKKCRELFRGWSQYSNTQGLQKIAQLHRASVPFGIKHTRQAANELPKRKVTVTQERSKVLRETEENPFGDEEEEAARQAAEQAAAGASAPSSSRAPEPAPHAPSHKKTSSSGSFFGSSKDKKKEKDKAKGGKRKPFNLEAEKETMKVVIADATIHSTTLLNTMQSINRETQRISDNPKAVEEFEACKQLRRRVLRYIHRVEQEEWLGSLLNANDALVHSLMSFEQMDRSIDADSDSDDELAEQAHMYRMMTEKASQFGKAPASPTSSQPPDLGGLSLNAPGAPPRPSATTKPHSSPPRQPPRPAPVQEDFAEDDDDDEDNPFGDRNVIETPSLEKGAPRW